MMKLSNCVSYVTVCFVVVFIFILTTFCDGSTYSTGSMRRARQLGFELQPYSQRQPSSEQSFFQSMMTLNFDMTEIFAMYRNVTAYAETPACFGHCRTPIALWVVQSFYPCYDLKKMDCPKGLVCCMQDPSQRLASANTLHGTRVKTPGRDRDTATSIPDRPTESTTLFDEEYYRNNFIQDEIPE